MSHACVYAEDECELCVEEASVNHRRTLTGYRGRYLVVDDGGAALRFRRKSSARAYVGTCRAVGIKARLLRWQRDRVHLPDLPFAEYEASDDRWLP